MFSQLNPKNVRNTDGVEYLGRESEPVLVSQWVGVLDELNRRNIEVPIVTSDLAALELHEHGINSLNYLGFIRARILSADIDNAFIALNTMAEHSGSHAFCYWNNGFDYYFTIVDLLNNSRFDLVITIQRGYPLSNPYFRPLAGNVFLDPPTDVFEGVSVVSARDLFLMRMNDVFKKGNAFTTADMEFFARTTLLFYKYPISIPSVLNNFMLFEGSPFFLGNLKLLLTYFQDYSKAEPYQDFYTRLARYLGVNYGIR